MHIFCLDDSIDFTIILFLLLFYFYYYYYFFYYLLLQLFYGDKRKAAADGVRSRLMFPQTQSDILALIGDSVDNWRTKQYDWYQERTNNIQY